MSPEAFASGRWVWGRESPQKTKMPRVKAGHDFFEPGVRPRLRLAMARLRQSLLQVSSRNPQGRG